MAKRKRTEDRHASNALSSRMENAIRGDNSGIITGVNNGTYNIHNYAVSSSGPIADKHTCHRSFWYSVMDDRKNGVRRAELNTCQWLSSHASYLEWQRRCTGLLWIQGHPGSGKSTLLRHALDLAASAQQSDPSIVIASHFFHARGDDLQKNVDGFLRSLIHQILPLDEGYWEELASLFDGYLQSRGAYEQEWTWHTEDLKTILLQAVAKVSGSRSIQIFVDAVDEAGKEVAQDVADFLEELLSSVQRCPGSLRICFTGRHWPVIRVHTELQVVVEHHNGTDISSFTRRRLKQARVDANIAREVEAKLVSKANGIFQWIVLVLTQVIDLDQQGQNRATICAQIDQLPPELDALYLQLLQTIVRDDERNDTKARSLRLFRWLSFTRRPLTVKEMPYVLALDPSKTFKSLEEVRIDSAFPSRISRNIKHLSRGLAEITKSHKVQFVHQSVNDYILHYGLGVLEATASLSASNAACKHLYGSCVQYLQLTLCGPTPWTLDQWTTYRMKNPFGDHCARFWPVYTRRMREMNLLEPVDLLSTLAKMLPRLMTYSHSFDLPELKLLKSTAARPEHFIAILGLASIVDTLCSGVEDTEFVQYDWDARDLSGKTPLMYAAESGYEELVKKLISCAKVDVNARDKKHASALDWAARNGQWDVVRCIVWCAPDLRVVDRNGQKRSALYLAAHACEYQIVDSLLKSATDPGPGEEGNAGSRIREHTLCVNILVPLIASREDLKLLKVMIPRVIDLTGKSAQAQRARIVALLTDNNSVECLRYVVQTLSYPVRAINIHAAIRAISLDMMQVLLSGWEASINKPLGCAVPLGPVRRAEEATALHFAAHYCNAAFINCLIERYQANVHILAHGFSTLDFAVHRTNLDAARALLAGRFDVNKKTIEGKTALHSALDCEKIMCISSGNRLELVRFLLAEDAAVNAQDDMMRTPTAHLIEHLMRCRYIGEDHGDELYRSSLFTIIKELLHHGADVTIPSKSGFAPVSMDLHGFEGTALQFLAVLKRAVRGELIDAASGPAQSLVEGWRQYMNEIAPTSGHDAAEAIVISDDSD